MFLLLASLTAGETCKETLLCKVSDADAHVVSFVLKVGGLRPSNTSVEFYQQFEPERPKASRLGGS